ncbi:MAG: molybdopterin-dependent oxidoreductase [Clostridia bacterium]|nr:molybdopterin-dependent oxidoreductase [Clostridia bacterium]
MKKETTRRVAALALALCVCLGCCTPAVAENAQTDSAVYGNDIGPFETWEDAWNSMYDRTQRILEENKPETTTLSNGVTVQRTPDDGRAFNNRIYNADNRGCFACHEDLNTLVMGIEFSSIGNISFFEHFELSNPYGIDYDIGMCVDCHEGSTSRPIADIIHAYHGSDNRAFSSMGGDCWSCHISRDGEMKLWDEQKHRVLSGITNVRSDILEGEITYTQDVITGDVFTLGWITAETDRERVLSHYVEDMTPDPLTDGVYDSWTIDISGAVDTPTVFTLSELMEKCEIVTTTMTYACYLNPIGGGLIANPQITGIRLKDVFDLVGVHEDATVYWPYDAKKTNLKPNFIDHLDEFGAYIVFEINGEPLTYEEGYPVQLWVGGTTAHNCKKKLDQIVITTDDPQSVGYLPALDNLCPAAAITHFKEGQIISSEEPYTFEGYVFGYEYPVTTIEISFDKGATWMVTELPQEEIDPSQWVYWYFEWMPPAPGTYTIMVRSTDIRGNSTPNPISYLINAR